LISELKNESYIRTTDMLEEQKMKEAAEEETLGRDAFLTLFTTQLKNQNPLDPMGNEAFVAQLAQFSQVEGIKGMQSSMEDLVSTIKGEQMLAGSQLVGKRVAVAGGYISGGDGQSSEGFLDLPAGAKGVAYAVYDASTDTPIFRGTMGPQGPGQTVIPWNGRDSEGEKVPVGNYVIKANVVSNGKLTAVPVTTLVGVKSVSWKPDTQEINLEVDGGSSVTMGEVARIAN